ncbi:MAG TPA: YMGG-like glycine zipper-containing protein, partial [Alphaproteobacteria bacterium]|nr:YMGG-like glycine zipper-containing protein [Alphaproteobacteria bacterium]
MKTYQSVAGIVAASLLLGACAHEPMGPRVAVMPGQGKPFEVFQQDQSMCQAYANQQVGGEARDANNRAVGSAVLGTLLGAGLGAAVGGGRGAAIGAGAGAVAGTAYGANGSQYEQGGIQRQYDIAYSQCMYSRGNQVPGYGGGRPRAYGPPPGQGGYGPPAGGGYGPPPPGY